MQKIIQKHTFYSGMTVFTKKIKICTMSEVQREKKERMTILISVYIYDWGAKGWGDMELSFDVEWK